MHSTVAWGESTKVDKRRVRRRRIADQRRHWGPGVGGPGALLYSTYRFHTAIIYIVFSRFLLIAYKTQNNRLLYVYIIKAVVLTRHCRNE